MTKMRIAIAIGMGTVVITAIPHSYAYWHMTPEQQHHLAGIRVPLNTIGDRRISIDGDLSDWGDLRDHGSVLNQHFLGLYPRRDPREADAALVKLVRCPDALYVAARIRDDSVVGTDGGGAWFEQDSVADICRQFPDAMRRLLDGLDPAHEGMEAVAVAWAGGDMAGAAQAFVEWFKRQPPDPLPPVYPRPLHGIMHHDLGIRNGFLVGDFMRNYPEHMAHVRWGWANHLTYQGYLYTRDAAFIAMLDLLARSRLVEEWRAREIPRESRHDRYLLEMGALWRFLERFPVVRAGQEPLQFIMPLARKTDPAFTSGIPSRHP